MRAAASSAEVSGSRSSAVSRPTCSIRPLSARSCSALTGVRTPCERRQVDVSSILSRFGTRTASAHPLWQIHCPPVVKAFTVVPRRPGRARLGEVAEPGQHTGSIWSKRWPSASAGQT